MTTVTVEPALTCGQCGQPRPDHREKYCTDRCARAARQKRYRANRWAAGLPVCAQRGSTPYDKFVSATVAGKRVQVPETPEHQAKAEALIKRGVAAYRNRAGLIRDIGVPKKPRDRGRVFVNKPPKPVKRARDSRERRHLVRWIRWVMTGDGWADEFNPTTNQEDHA